MRQYCSRYENAEEVFLHEFNLILTHEMLHMASSYYDAERDIVYGGLHKAPYELRTDSLDGGSYVALTEGITEYLSHKICKYNLSIGYKEQYEMVEKLIDICGEDTIYLAYFEAKGPEIIKKKLYEIIPNRDKIDQLFGDIELGFQFKNYDYLEDAKVKNDNARACLKEFANAKRRKSSIRTQISSLFSTKADSNNQGIER